MPKKTPCNAFYFFMLEKKNYNLKHGIRCTMKTLPAVVSPEWNALKPEEKQKYEKMAKEAKANGGSKIPFENKLASDGTSVLENLQKQTEEEQQKRREQLEIRTAIQADTLGVDEFKENVITIKFYVMSFNIICKVKEDIFDTYIPIEIGICEYSIERGIIKSYHKFIDFGKIPVGYSGIAKAQSEEYHKLLYADLKKEKNYRGIWREIERFLGAADCEEWPQIFILDEQVPQTEGCLRWLAAQAGQHYPRIRVLNFSQLLFEVRQAAGCHIPVTVANDLLKKTCFDYTPNNNCDYHEEIDSPYCALGVTKRLCYLFSDASCKAFNVKITSNHIPNRCVALKEYSVYSPAQVNTKESSLPRSVRVGDNLDEKKSRADELDEFDDDEDDPPQPRYSSNIAIGRGYKPNPQPSHQLQQFNSEFAKLGLGRGMPYFK